MLVCICMKARNINFLSSLYISIEIYSTLFYAFCLLVEKIFSMIYLFTVELRIFKFFEHTSFFNNYCEFGARFS